MTTRSQTGGGPGGLHPEPLALAVVVVLVIGLAAWFFGRSFGGPQAMTDLPRIGQLQEEQLRDCPPELYADHAFQASSPGFIPDPAYHEHQREVLEECTAPFVLWARLAAAACDPPILEKVDGLLGSERPLSAALDRLVTDGAFRDCYRRWLDD